MDESITPLAASFAAATPQAWLDLVQKTLKGAGVESLYQKTADGLTIEPLYVSGRNSIVTNLPRAARFQDRAWDIRAIIAQPDLIKANSQVLEHLQGGASSILLRIGEQGVAVNSADELDQVLQGVLTDVAPVAIDAGFLGIQAAEWLSGIAKASPAAPLALHLDPLSAFARAGASPGPIQAHLIASANLAARLADTYPRASLFLASGKVVHEAGGTPAWELAFAAASALTYAKGMVRSGISQSVAFERIVMGLTVDADAIASIVKLRAGRILWAKITAACGVAAPARLEARSSDRMLTCADPWTNLVRLTSAGFAGAVGGADALVLANFTDALGLPSLLARRLARNTQLILMEEAHVGAVADPAAGAWAVEAQCKDLARAAWAHFATIEAAGGLTEAMESGIICDAVANSRETLRAAIANKTIRILGVTDFPDAKPTPPDIDDPWPGSAPSHNARLPGPDSHCPALLPVRLEDLAA